MGKLRDFIAGGRKILSPLYGEREAVSLIAMLCAEMLGVERHTHLVYPDYEINAEALPALEEALERLVQGEPIQYIVGKAEFFGRTFRVAPGVLIPRPETEQLCRMALEWAREKDEGIRVLDLCTGSGCIAWTMAAELERFGHILKRVQDDAEGGIEVVGVDISEEALAIARGQEGLAELGYDLSVGSASAAVRFVRADVLEEEDGRIPDSVQDDAEGKFDLILSNPPYVRESERAMMQKNVLEHEPALALFVDDNDPLIFYRAIARWAQKLLADNGLGIVEINEAFGRETAEVFREAGFEHTNIIKDLNGKDRFVIFARWFLGNKFEN